jgi:putative ABC transport system permease protein
MEKLFGIPIEQLMVALLIVFGIGVVVMIIVAMRNRVIFKLALRNAPRRRAQSALIVMGLMLATLLISASLGTGDTLSHSIRVQALKEIGEVDIVVQTEAQEASGQPVYYDQAYFEMVRGGLSSISEVESVAPLAAEVAPVVVDTGLNEAQVNILGYAAEWMSGFDRLEDEDGEFLSLSTLAPGQVYISSDLANELNIIPGGTVYTFFGTLPAILEVSGIFEKGANPSSMFQAAQGVGPSGDFSLVMPLAQLQTLTGNENKINFIIITNQGDAIQGVQHTETVLSSLEPLLEGSELEADPIKQDILDTADEAGSAFSTIFLVFGQFSITAGILLIFLIFIMLAAERKSELGIARAVGAQRGHIIRMFAFEGAIYALIAAAIGSLLGVAAGWGMIRIMAIAFGQIDLELTFAFNWRSVVIAYTMGMVLTFAVVMISSWRVSRLNIVRAIRDIAEPSIKRKTIKGLILTILIPVVGIFLAISGLQGEQLSFFMLGISLVIIGLPLLARRFGISDRVAFTIAGLGLIVWWLLPSDALESFLPEMQQGIEMFFISGIMLVIGAVWTVIYNSELLLALIVRIFGRIRGLPPILKTAVSYPMQNRFRTGITLAMFSLIVFTLVVMAFITNSMGMVFEDTETISGGYDIRANTSYTNPIPDINIAIQSNDGVNPNDFEAIGSLNGALVEVRQEETDQVFADMYLQGVDSGYTDSVNYKFTMATGDYNSPREVWQALQEEPGTVVVSSVLVPTKVNYAMGEPALDFQLEGFFIEDEVLPVVFIQVQDPNTGSEQSLRVIGVLDQQAFYASMMITSQDTVNSLLSQSVPPLSYMFKLGDDFDAETTAKALELTFVQHGMQAESIEKEIRDISSANSMINNLLQGFMGLGLLVGIAALGVIAARSVVERRKQIGVLRALGFQKSMVQFSFLLESSFVALLGIGLGIALGAGLSVLIIDEMSSAFEGIRYQIPWINILVIAVIAYGASLLTTYLPARQASKVYPAEALRFE